MGKLIWRLRAAALLWFLGGVPIRQVWAYSGTFDHEVFDGLSPREAVTEEMSYWER